MSNTRTLCGNHDALVKETAAEKRRPDGTQDEATIALPAGTAISFRGETSVTDEDDFAFTTHIPGTYVFKLSPPFPYVPRTIMIEATDAV
ncbi:hypothetical protein OCK02_25515 [Rhizobium sp. TRM96647]|uniref:hypothetical protein n=1 Tax=unclassified Rhizobium TaxID=2613769 RepID=UPI0021E86708|nr:MULTISPECIES: hypothetical protein [unclassified Rhizobium]MCV3739500.1 hypothetical protein [Rhizobium sp. TRM96647]MCV3761175.1 hypothetical protein [Rhizobium sp. TRM96650]